MVVEMANAIVYAVSPEMSFYLLTARLYDWHPYEKCQVFGHIKNLEILFFIFKFKN